MVLRNGRSRTLLGRALVAALATSMFLGLEAIAFQAGAPAPRDGAGPPSKVKLGLSVNNPGAFRGYTLLAPMKSQKTYLIDMEGRVVKTWESESNPALLAYLLPNGHLFRPAEDRDQPFGGGPGAGGRIQEYDWDGQLVWDFKYGDETHRPHHDAIKLPNGNVLMIVWEKKSPEEAAAAGRKPDRTGNRPLQADCLIEVKPTGKTTGEVVWEWHLWDHLIQDQDAAKPNYGEVAAHPELVDVNFEEGAMAAMVATKDGLDKLRTLGYLGGAPKGDNRPPRIDPDWTHFNGLDYNPDLDQIAISVHGFSEVWIIDHSTTAAEAASHSGGRSGKGGDLLYRWGNPLAYRTGGAEDRKLYHQHNAHWIPKDRPGAGHLLIFNNGMRRPGGEYSTVEEIVTPVDSQGRYTREAGKPFGPDRSVWSYSAPKKSDFYSALISGAQRLSNGNTLICSGNNGTLFEVTPGGEIVWKYVNPVKDRWGPGGPGGPPRPSDVLPFFLRDRLDLSKDQRKDLDAFQKEVDDTLQSTLNEDQRKRFTERRGFGPASFAPPGQLMALSTQITLKLTAEQKSKINDLQKAIDAKLDSLLTPDQKAEFQRMREDFARGVPGRGPGGPGGPPGGPPGFGPGGPFGGPPGGPGGPFGGPPGGGGVFRAYRYAPDYPGLAGRSLTPGKTVEELQPKDDEKDK